MGVENDQLQDDATDLEGEGLGEGLSDDQHVDEGAPEAGSQDADAPAADAGDESADEGDLVITIGDEQPPAEDADTARAPEWVRELRKSNREKDRRLREQEAEIARLKGGNAAQPTAVVVGDKPTLSGCEFDEVRYEQELDAWHARKLEADEAQRKKNDAEKADRDAWQSKLDAYGRAKAGLKVSDFEDAEESVKETFSVIQQGVMIKGVRDPDVVAKLIYALGKNPKKAKELAAINDPVEFAVAIGEVKTMLKSAPRRTPPVPEREVRGSAPGSSAIDNQLERLRADARKSGDYSKVTEYQRNQRASEQRKRA